MTNIDERAEEEGSLAIKTFMTKAEFNALLEQGMTPTNAPTQNGVDSYKFENRIYGIRRRPNRKKPFENVYSYQI